MWKKILYSIGVPLDESSIIDLKSLKKVKIINKTGIVKNSILEGKRKREIKLSKLKLKYLSKVKKLKENNSGMINKLIDSFSDWSHRIKYNKPKLINGKVRDLEEIAVKEVIEPYITISIPSREDKIKAKLKYIDEGIIEIKKPIQSIKKDVVSKKKGIKKLLSSKIYKRTKELIKLEKKAKLIEKEIDELKNPSEKSSIKKKTKSAVPSRKSIRRNIEILVSSKKNISSKFKKLNETEKTIVAHLEKIKKSRKKYSKDL